VPTQVFAADSLYAESYTRHNDDHDGPTVSQTAMAKAGLSLSPDSAYCLTAGQGGAGMKFLDSDTLVHSASGGLVFIDVRSEAEVAKLPVNGVISALATCPETARLAYTDTSNSSKVSIVEYPSLTEVGAVEMSNTIDHLSFSRDGSLLFAVAKGTATVWKWAEGLAMQHEPLSKDEFGMGAAFCSGIDNPVFVSVGACAARLVRVGGTSVRISVNTNPTATSSDPSAAEDVKDAALASFCWAPGAGLWLGSRTGVLSLVRIESLSAGTGDVAEVQAEAETRHFGGAITHLSASPKGLIAGTNKGHCYWLTADTTLTRGACTAIVAEARLDGATSPCTIAVSPRGCRVAARDPNRLDGVFMHVPCWPEEGASVDLTSDVHPFSIPISLVKAKATTLNTAAATTTKPAEVSTPPAAPDTPVCEVQLGMPMPPALSLPPAALPAAPPAVTTVSAADEQLQSATVLAPIPAVVNSIARAGDEQLPTPAPGRTCAHCRTQKTPLWRNGPLGPKTLCNACGVRFKLGKLQMPAGGFQPAPPSTYSQPVKRPALMNNNSNPLKRQKPNPKTTAHQRRPLRTTAGSHHVYDDDYVTCKGSPTTATFLTDYDGAVLLMVLAGMYARPSFRKY